MGPHGRTGPRHRLRTPRASGATSTTANWEQVQVALHVSAYSLKALVEAFRPLLVAAGADGRPGASVVGLDFDTTVAWPAYDWMGVSKAALESAVALPGSRPRTRAHPCQPGGGRTGEDHGGQVHPRLQCLRGHLVRIAPRWAGTSSTPTWWTRACVALLSDLLPMTTGEILHVDGGVHAVGT